MFAQLDEPKSQCIKCTEAIVRQSETWLDASIFDNGLICGNYTAFAGDKALNGESCRGGGLAIFVPDIYTATSYGPPYRSQTFEAIAVKIELSNESLVTLNVYRPQLRQ